MFIASLWTSSGWEIHVSNRYWMSPNKTFSSQGSFLHHVGCMLPCPLCSPHYGSDSSLLAPALPDALSCQAPMASWYSPCPPAQKLGANTWPPHDSS